MISSEGYDTKLRNKYVRYLIKLLNKKYFVAQAPIAASLKISPNYLRDFTKETRNLSNERLNLIEDFLTDLFGGLLEFEIPQTRSEFDQFIKELPESIIYKEIVN